MKYSFDFACTMIERILWRWTSRIKEKKRTRKHKCLLWFLWVSAYKYLNRSALENLNCRLYPPKIREKMRSSLFVWSLHHCGPNNLQMCFCSSPSNKIFLFQIIYKVFGILMGHRIDSNRLRVVIKQSQRHGLFILLIILSILKKRSGRKEETEKFESDAKN